MRGESQGLFFESALLAAETRLGGVQTGARAGLRAGMLDGSRMQSKALEGQSHGRGVA